jgi:protein-disulfide isomerase
MSVVSQFARRELVLLILLIAGLSCFSYAEAQPVPSEGTKIDDRALIQKIKEEIIKELRDSEFLRREIEAGIQDYVKKQRDAQVAAQVGNERLAKVKAENLRRVSSPRDHVYGNTNAPISLIVYSDFECPFCKRFHSTAKEIVDAYQGKVNLVYRHFPLSFHNPGAQKQAEASECANELGGNDAFWQFTDAIYARTRSNGKGFPVANLTPLATEIGLDGEQFRQCLDSGKQATRVKEDFTEGAQIGITGTPANFLLHNRTGETRVKSGAQPVTAFKADIDKMLN